MNKPINLKENELLKEKIYLLINECDYSYVITNGLKLLNNEMVSINDKVAISYKVAFSYKKNNNYEQAINIVKLGIDYYNELTNKTCEDYYHRMVWLKNNCMKELGIENLDEALNDFIAMKKYYESIGEVRGASMVGFTYGYWKKDSEIMFHHFKKIVKSNPVITNVKKNHRNNVACEEALLEIKEVDIYCYEIAKEYADSYIRDCI